MGSTSSKDRPSKGKDGGRVKRENTSMDKWMIALVVGILFFLLASPYIFDATNTLTMSLMRLQLTNAPGCPNMAGVMIHAILFVLIIRFLLITNN